MKKYTIADVAEQQLEELVRRHSDMIERGLVYVDHQKPTAGGRLDVLMMDSGKSIVVAELKVTQNDDMLLQGLDYYDYVTTHVESFARLYKNHAINPNQPTRLFLIAPSFSQALVNRCKWLNVPVFLFSFNCLKFDGEEDLTPVFSEQQIPSTPVIIETIPTIEAHLAYITDSTMRSKASALLNEIKNWKPENISLDPIKYAISIKVNNRVFAYFHPRRQHYLITTFNADDEWTDYPVKGDDDLATVKPLVKSSMEKRLK